MIKKSDFNALTQHLNDIFNEVSSNKLAEMVSMKLFNVKETNWEIFTHQVLHGISGIEEVADGQDLPRVTGAAGDNITWTQRGFGANVPVTDRMRTFDLYDEIEGITKSIIEDAWDKLDQSCADMLLNGWSTSYTDVYNKTVSNVCPDSAAPFSASHDFGGASATTYTTIITDGTNTNPAISRAAMMNTIAAGLKFSDANSQVRPIYYDTLIVPPDLADDATRYIESDRLAGGLYNDTNVYLKSRIKEILVWERLSQTGQGSSRVAYWFMADSKKVKETLNLVFARRPQLNAPVNVHENGNWDYTLLYYYVTGLGFPAYIRGSKGDAS